jgi:hypothetical protein
MPNQIFDFFSELDFIVGNITALVVLLTVASLFIANTARYVQAKNYGIPLKMVYQASIPDSLDIWITLISAFGVGLFIPILMLTVETYTYAVFVITLISCFIGIASTKANAGYNITNKDGAVERTVNLSWIFYSLVALLTAAAIAYVHSAFSRSAAGGNAVSRSIPQMILLISSILMQVLYILLIFTSLVSQMYKRIIGSQEIMTAEINGQLYLIAMRHIKNYWVMIPCTIEKNKARGNIHIGKGEPDMIDAIKFVKGRFIIRDIASLEDTKSLLCRTKHKLIGVKE